MTLALFNAFLADFMAMITVERIGGVTSFDTSDVLATVDIGRKDRKKRGGKKGFRRDIEMSKKKDKKAGRS